MYSEVGSVRGIRESEQEAGPTREGALEPKLLGRVKGSVRLTDPEKSCRRHLRVKDSANPPHREQDPQPVNTINKPRTSTPHLEVTKSIQSHKTLIGATPATSPTIQDNGSLARTTKKGKKPKVLTGQ
eukprot:g45699.t1